MNKYDYKKNIDIIDVIWVDDEYKNLMFFIERLYTAWEINGRKIRIKAMPFDNWKDAEQEIKSHPEFYDYLILDVKCKYDKDSEPSATEFILKVILKEVLNYDIPYFIFSAGTKDNEDRVELLRIYGINEKSPDKLWQKSTGHNYYDKATEAKILKENIINAYIKRKEWEAQSLFHNVFMSLRELNVDYNVDKHLTSILTSLISPNNNIKNFTYHKELIRNCMEHLFRTMSKYELIPKDFIDKTHKDEINFSACFDWIIENPIRGAKFGFTDSIIEYLKSIKKIIPSLKHTNESDDPDAIDEYVIINQSAYFLYSITLWLCDFILWLTHFIKFNPNKNEIQKECREKNKEKYKRGILKKRDGRNGKFWCIYPKEKIENFNKEWIKVDNSEIAKIEDKFKDNQSCRFKVKENNKNLFFAFAIDEDLIKESQSVQLIWFPLYLYNNFHIISFISKVNFTPMSSIIFIERNESL